MLSKRQAGDRCVFALVVASLLVGFVAPSAPAVAGAVSEEEPVVQTQSMASPARFPLRLYLPLITKSETKLSTRLGYCATGGGMSTSRYPEINTLRAGWYVDWLAPGDLVPPGGAESVGLVRLHQKLTCVLGSEFAHDRSVCPYAQPYDYVVSPSKDELRQIVLTRPGSLWLIGNEVDRRDYPWGGQDEMLPEVYAVAYHDIYTLIKEADPTARIANAGVIQPTPLRLEYLNKMWDAYLARYGTTMPVDVWNTHNFILQELLYSHGASIPPGSSATAGVVYDSDWTHVDLEIFQQQVKTFRSWMKDHDQQDKPLIVSEFGVLYWHDAMESPGVVTTYMLGAFDTLLNAKDCNLGFPGDDCRLVQRWAWYSLDDLGNNFNRYGALFDPLTLQITETGVQFRNFSLTNLEALHW